MAERIGFSVIGTLAALAVDASPRSLRRQARRVVARAGRQLARETTWPVQPELMNGLQSMSEVVARVSPDDFSNGEASGRPRLDATRP
jgi:hypothetical protein